MSVDTIPEVVQVLEPAPPAQRLPALDLLRGIAILGILPANIPFFSGTISIFTMQSMPETGADRAALFLTIVLVFGKFVTLLSILFGAGLALQVWKARTEGQPFAGYYVRRMLILFIIGVAHGLFLWFGDILSSYAIVALLALLFTRFSQRLVLFTAAGCLLVVGTWLVLALGVTLTTGAGLADLMPHPEVPPAAKESPDPAERMWADLGHCWQDHVTPENQARIWRESSFWEMAFNRAVYLMQYIPQFWVALVWYLLACFLIGVYLLRREVFHDLEANRSFVRKLIGVGLLIGVPLQLIAGGFYLIWPGSGFHFTLPYTLGALPLALAYLGFGVLWSASGRLAWLQAALQDVGRTALSNYILQSILCNLIYYRWGLVLYGELGHAANLGVVAGVWLVEILLSVLWLRFFAMGPVEWLWRSLAEGRRQPMFRAAAC
ncbi:hypothetical protein AYO44_08130 [Planctomycetaceae bacterium SCGC AG-212-F19]|nr:hypothetical protein AYO44_08130 [Planctomycetaceae bacterium SCGC AG-212-F19]